MIAPALRRLVLAALAMAMGVGLAAAPAAAQRAPRAVPVGRMIEFDQQRDGMSRTYVSGGLTITISARGPADARRPVIRIVAPNGAVLQQPGQQGLTNVTARFGVGRVDPTVAGPQVIFSSFSGGAHCCQGVMVFQLVGRTWRVIELGDFDSDPTWTFPRDINGDGTPDLVGVDESFNYAFDSYAASLAPPKIYNLVGGRLIDVSANPGFRPVFQERLGEARQGCEQHSNGACAGFVAIAARLGRGAWAWPIFLRSYDQTSDWTWPTSCRIRVRRGATCPESQIIRFPDMPSALSHFLQEEGYTASRLGQVR